MIYIRLKKAGYNRRWPLFQDEAVQLIYQMSQGCPRKITMLSHDALELLIMRNKDVIDKSIVQDLMTEELRVMHGAYRQ
jgi:type II secretory pathway predicted ATPase ExeA